VSGLRTAAVVVGAHGFVGWHVAAALCAAGAPVIAVGRSNTADLGVVLHRAAVVFYLAGTVTPQTAESAPDKVRADHSAFTELLASCMRRGTLPILALASSGGTVYDSAAPAPYTENTPTRPATAYGCAKFALEQAALAATGAVRPLVVRLSNVYGPGQRPRGGLGVIAHWLEAARTGGQPVLYGDPDVARDYVFVGDVASALVGVWTRREELADSCPLILNVGSGVPTSLSQVFRAVCAAVGRDLSLTAAPARRFDRSDVWLDIAKASDTLGWRPAVSLEEGVMYTWRALSAVESPPADPRLPVLGGRDVRLCALERRRRRCGPPLRPGTQRVPPCRSPRG
jgi:UDP-glucose 4-epimerase